MKQEILDKLKLELGDKKEMDPDKHDGSYQLVREMVKILSKYPIQKLGPKDLNMLYFATVGTFSKSINDKINNIKDSSLSKEDKDYLLNILDGIWKNVSDGKYENNGEDGSFGMFGTGVGKVRASDSDSRLFLGMCIKLLSLDDEEEMFSVVENTLKNPLKYIGIAIVSQILHCLKPFVFPIFNNATQELGLSKDTTEYIENTKKLEKFRNDNFKFKNYRIFDMGLWDLEEDRGEDDELALEDILLQKLIDENIEEYFNRRIGDERNEKYKRDILPVVTQKVFGTQTTSKNILDKIEILDKNKQNRVSFMGNISDLKNIAQSAPVLLETEFTHHLFSDDKPIKNRIDDFIGKLGIMKENGC